ncbi:MAG TPA: primosomal protein N' [Candidatus Kapabacteria bacterium]|nr:primosomal protein N' [Candidatus Kapabacteria bacterium]
MPTYALIALPIPVFTLFTYAVPTRFGGMVHRGIRVTVPFGKRTLTGVVVDEADHTDVAEVRELIDVLDAQPLFSEEILRFAEWMSEYYVSPMGETLRTMLPYGTTPESTQRISIAAIDVDAIVPELRRTAPRQAAVLLALSDHPNGVTIPFLQRKVGADNLHSQLAALESKGYIERTIEMEKASRPKRVRGARVASALLGDEPALHRLFDELDRAAPKQALVMSQLFAESERSPGVFHPVAEILERAKTSDSVIKALLDRGAIELEMIDVSREEVLSGGDEGLEDDNYESTLGDQVRDFVLNDDQRRAVETISAQVASREFKTFLLHGVTGSGKTQVYIESIRAAIAGGRTAIMLVPEIGLTLQLVERFREAFGDRIAVLHSRLSDGERFDAWRRVAAGGCDVVIGARSALFAPLRNVGIIVIDEEHEASYKQYDQQPRYHARDAAVVRAQIEGAVAVLGSATPSIESYHNAERGKYQLLELPVRVDNAREPVIVIVDTLTARRQRLMRGSLSVRMLNDVRARLDKGEGVILFQNRRGFATRLECGTCSHSPMCPSCAVTLTFHKHRHELRCHYCGYCRKAETQCVVCGSLDLRQPGVGTQRVEEELAEHLPGARIVRMDQDTTSRKGAHRKILSRFANGEVDILLGTQMVAKGLDFSRVSLVGVVSADTQLLLPDFRASERTFQLLTQVAGRAGRRSEVQGEVVIQTAHPEHPAVMAAFAKNYRQMYDDEVRTRRQLNYPPFSRFIVIEFRSADQKDAEQAARQFRALMPASGPAFEILGPSAALIWKLRNLYRYQIVVKNHKAQDPGGKIFARSFANAYEAYRQKHGKTTVQVIVDVDAMGM